MNTRLLIAAVALLAGATANAAFRIELNLDGKPIRDARESTFDTIVGYAGCGHGWDSDTALFRDNPVETSRLMREAGAWNQRMWHANEWFANRNKKGKDGKPLSDPEAAFKFWKANGFKILMTLECWNDNQKQEILEFVRYIVDNKYQDCIIGFELGNETYYSKGYPAMAPRWTEVVNEIVKIWPGVKLGINVAELFELNPDITQVRNRMLAAGELKRDTYFAAADFNRYSAQFIVGMSNCMDKITHVIYHAYGAETPYSCSYHGYKRFRAFNSCFPELAGKRMWLSEVRQRSDEDNFCQRIFRESLIMAHYSIMTMAQPDIDGFNHHQLLAISGGLYQSNGKEWMIQWRDSGPSYRDYRAPMNQPRAEVGSMGVMYRILAEGVKDHPLFFHHGTSRQMDTEDAFYTSARFTDEVYAHRRALKEGKRGGAVPKVKGEVEWLAATDARRNELCLLMVNSKDTAEEIRVTAPGREFAAPTYRTLSCPAKYVDCRAVPGEGRVWSQTAWEDTQFGYQVIPMEKYEGMKPKCDVLTVTIEPHTVQTVTVCMRKTPKK